MGPKPHVNVEGAGWAMTISNQPPRLQHKLQNGVSNRLILFKISVTARGLKIRTRNKSSECLEITPILARAPAALISQKQCWSLNSYKIWRMFLNLAIIGLVLVY